MTHGETPAALPLLMFLAVSAAIVGAAVALRPERLGAVLYFVASLALLAVTLLMASKLSGRRSPPR
jgi:hypothetical protein